MNTSKLYSQIEGLPEDLKKEVEDFVQFLYTKNQIGKISIEDLEGKWEGLIKMNKDFDEPLEDFKEYMQ
jgi:hypothetical protein